MRIGIVVGRMGGVDGVALETEKWMDVLKRMGHEPYLLCGEFERQVLPEEQQTTYEPMSFFSRECAWEQKNAFYVPDPGIDQDVFLNQVEKNAEKIANVIDDWVKDKKIDVLMPENSSALPCHLSMGLGIKKYYERSGIDVFTHDHDWAWERGDRYKSEHFPKVNDLVRDTFPLIGPNVKHAVINLYNKDSLKKEYGEDALVVPNVMDFDVDYGKKDEYNADLRETLGLEEDDKVLLQVTRLVPRKKVETAIELVGKLKDPKVKLVVTGNAKDDETGTYMGVLRDEVKKYGVEDQVIWASDYVADHRKTENGHKVYSLSDFYSIGDACTYFSNYEGFGNAFVEGTLANKVHFVNNYEPVYMPDIGSKGFKTVMIENNNLTDEAVEKMRMVLNNDKLRERWAEFNFDLGKKHFSYDNLEERLTKLLPKEKGGQKEKVADMAISARKENGRDAR